MGDERGSAWDLARAAASAAGTALRPLTSLEDADRILDVMVQTWGEHQLLPREMIRALADCGNVPYGAFEGEEMIGYVLGWAGVEPQDGLHVHSHMLAALAARRHRGVGYALKLAQRAQCLDQGIHLVRWTFDPLVARNAWFNLSKLGAVGDRFHRNFYGDMSDTLNAGERSDRVVVRWDLDREPGPRRAATGDYTAVLGAKDPNGAGRPVLSIPPSDAPGGLVQIPRDYASVRDRDPGLAREWRDAVATAIEATMATGAVAVTFARDASAYVFAPEASTA